MLLSEKGLGSTLVLDKEINKCMGRLNDLGEEAQKGDTHLIISNVSPQNSDASQSGMLSRLGDLLFYTIAEGEERIPIHKFTRVSCSLSVLSPHPLGLLDREK